MIGHCSTFQLWKSVKISPGLWNTARLTAVSRNSICFTPCEGSRCAEARWCALPSAGCTNPVWRPWMDSLFFTDFVLKQKSSKGVLTVHLEHPININQSTSISRSAVVWFHSFASCLLILLTGQIPKILLDGNPKDLTPSASGLEWTGG